MRRTALIFGLLLTLTAGVWSSALAAVVYACCADETSAASTVAALPAPDEHDCCRARFAEPGAPPAEATGHAHEAATHEDELSPAPQVESSHAGMDCANSKEPESDARVTAFGERLCSECCVGRGNQVPTTATFSAPEQNRAKRDAASVYVNARELFAPGTQGVAHLSPSQHAPPASRERRHILISVFLI
ncbi:MAG TPA: hypothetical protein VGB76_17815 [Pyrinomonadaceae bacterium]|jgi:hypothetical protein